MVATAPFRLDLLTIDKNTETPPAEPSSDGAGTTAPDRRLVPVTFGHADGTRLDFVFIRPPARAGEGAPDPTRGVRLFTGDGDGDLVVEESSQGGSVPILRVENRGSDPYLLIAGQVVRGGKQNRGLVSDVLVAPGTNCKIPVTCVEQGRWSDSGRSFEHDGFEPLDVRASKLRLSSPQASRLRRASMQREVWRSIEDLQADLQVGSRSSDLGMSFDAVRSGTFDDLAVPGAGDETQGASTTDGGLQRHNPDGIPGDIDRTLLDLRRALEQGYASLWSQLHERIRGALDEIETTPIDSMFSRVIGVRESVSREVRGWILEASRYKQRLVDARRAAAERRDRANEGSSKGDGREAADEAAKGSTGMLVFLNGDFIMGDLLGRSEWFERLYADLRDSSALSWHQARRRSRLGEQRPDETDDSSVLRRAESVLRDAAGADWHSTDAVSAGRAWRVDHPFLESSALTDDNGEPLHIVIGTRETNGVWRRGARVRPMRM